MLVEVGGQLPLASGGKPLGHIVVSVCCLVGDGNTDGGGIAFEGGDEEGGRAFPRRLGRPICPLVIPPVLLLGGSTVPNEGWTVVFPPGVC